MVEHMGLKELKLDKLDLDFRDFCDWGPHPRSLLKKERGDHAKWFTVFPTNRLNTA